MIRCLFGSPVQRVLFTMHAALRSMQCSTAHVSFATQSGSEKATSESFLDRRPEKIGAHENNISTGLEVASRARRRPQ